MPALSLRDVTLTYPDGDGRLTAVDRANLDVDHGQFVALVGPSGSGKSSLLALAATLIRPDTGAVLIDGHDVAGLSDRARTKLRRDHIGIVFQQPNLINSLTTLEQLTLMAHLAGSAPRHFEEEAREMLRQVGVEDLSHRRPEQLSGGQRQRVSIARALMGNPSILLVDEPTSALDHERGTEVMALLRRLTVENNLATVVVTHDTSLLLPDDGVVECQDGQIHPVRVPV